MNRFFYTSGTVQEIVDSFQISLQSGLSAYQVAQQQKKHGPNTLNQSDVSWVSVLVRQCKSPFNYLLIGAALFSFFLKDVLNGSMIVLFMLINVILGFYHEYHAEHIVKMLRNLIVPKITVRRDGKDVVIATHELVPGDIVFIEPGDIIPADLRFLEVTNMTVDESALTGESEPVIKQSESELGVSDNDTATSNLGFCGTTVVSGSGIGVIIATGSQTALGSIAQMVHEVKRDSLFAQQINTLSKFMLVVMLVTLSGIFFVHFFFKNGTTSPVQLILFAIALAVSILPEALPVVISFCLARGASHLAQHHVVVRRLSAIEDLGGIEVLCTDKTGTITENNLSVVDVFGDRANVLNSALLANKVFELTLPENGSHSFDSAILKTLSHAKNIKLKQELFIPFMPESRCVAAVVKKEEEYLLVKRGALEALIDRCILSQGMEKHGVMEWAQKQGFLGRRVLAIATKNLSSVPTPQAVAHIGDLTLLGLIAFADEIKKTAPDSIKKARQLGLSVKILTGDAPEVAGAVAKHIGLISRPEDVITGAVWEKMNEREQYDALEYHAVFARVNPIQKLAIVKKLQEKHNVGFLGEGINDAPALKLAYVGLAVENATDIAKDAADIILLKKNLHVIVNGIEEGRKIAANTLKYLTVTLASNFSNFYTIALVSLFIDFLPMLPLQILLVNVLSDFPMIAIATDQVDHSQLAKPYLYAFKTVIGTATFFGILSSIFDFIFFSAFSLHNPGVLRTMWFMFNILSELAFFYIIRTRKPFYQALRPSVAIIGFSAMASLIALLLPLTQFGHRAFDFVTPTLQGYGVMFLIVLSYFGVLEVVKHYYYRWIA